jgi:hypothetical protein
MKQFDLNRMLPLTPLLHIRNVIHRHLLNSFYATSRAEFLNARHFWMIPVGQIPVLDPQITNARYPLVLTKGGHLSQNLMRDLLALGQVSHEQRQDYRAFLARTVHSLDSYLRIFHPKDPMNANRTFDGHQVIVAFASGWPPLSDATRFVKFWAHSPDRMCNFWSHNAWPVWNHTRTYAQQIALILFSSVGNFSCTYMAGGIEPSIERIRLTHFPGV